MNRHDPLAPGTHTITTGDTVQRYHVHGSGPVCVVHPGGPGFTWTYLRMPLLERRLTTVYLEPLGTGGSGRLPTHPHGYTRARHSAALSDLLDHLGGGPVHLLGHSHGGFVAQYHAARHPDRLAGIILYESAPAVGPDHFEEANRNLHAYADEHAQDPRTADILDAWNSIPTIEDDDAFTATARRLLPAYFADYAMREGEYAALRDSVTGTYISGLDAQARPDPIDDHDSLGNVTLPCLIVVGAYDFICGPRWAKALHALLPNSRMVTLQRSGHFGHIEEAEAFAAAVSSFVTGTAPR